MERQFRHAMKLQRNNCISEEDEEEEEEEEEEESTDDGENAGGRRKDSDLSTCPKRLSGFVESVTSDDGSEDR